jgi:transcriptional regulator with XRE-family HTH domain
MDNRWIIEELDARGSSQAELARHLGIDRGAMNRRIQGKTGIKTSEIPRLAEFLRLSEETVIARLAPVRASAARANPIGRAAAELRRPVTGTIPRDIETPILQALDYLREGQDSYPVALELLRRSASRVDTAIHALPPTTNADGNKTSKR